MIFYLPTTTGRSKKIHRLNSPASYLQSDLSIKPIEGLLIRKEKPSQSWTRVHFPVDVQFIDLKMAPSSHSYAGLHWTWMTCPNSNWFDGELDEKIRFCDEKLEIGSPHLITKFVLLSVVLIEF